MQRNMKKGQINFTLFPILFFFAFMIMLILKVEVEKNLIIEEEQLLSFILNNSEGYNNSIYHIVERACNGSYFSTYVVELNISNNTLCLKDSCKIISCNVSDVSITHAVVEFIPKENSVEIKVAKND